MIELIRLRSPWIWLSVSATTRRMRDYEVEGEHYFFVDRSEFERLRAGDQLLEWAEFAGNLYGTPRGPVEARLHEGAPVLLKIDLQAPGRSRPRCPRRSWSSWPPRSRSCDAA